MKTESSDSAYPLRSRWDTGSAQFDLQESGLTKREVFAAMAMQGWCANSHNDRSWNPFEIASI